MHYLNISYFMLPKNAVGEIMPVRFATTIDVPDSRNGAVKSTTDSLSALIFREVRTISNFFAINKVYIIIKVCFHFDNPTTFEPVLCVLHERMLVKLLLF